MISLAMIAAVFCFISVVAYCGNVKQDASGDLKVLDDSITASGRAGLTDALNDYWLAYSAGEPIGKSVLEDITGDYMLEGSFTSGFTAVFHLTQSIIETEVPAGYAGGSQDPVPGSKITFKVLFENTGDAAWTNSTILEAPVPENMSYATDTIVLTLENTDYSNPAACSCDGSKILCNIESISAHATGSIQFKAIIQ
ncbi:MAG TPA: hypothetical protein PLN69_01485 [bacterium]|nr:hypothetical protein [bacterium]